MKAHPISRSQLPFLISSVASWAAVPLIATSIAGLWLLLAEDSGWLFVLLAAPLALTAVLGLLRQHARFRAAGRFRAALDAYAEREISRERRRRVLERLRMRRDDLSRRV